MRGVVCHSDGIYTVDSRYGDQPRLAAVHIVIDHGKAAIIDTGSNASVPHILATLAWLDIKPEAVEWVILTHLHLDHAGGAGSLMCALPRARVVMHPSATHHLSNPAMLWKKTVAVYGPEQTFRLYGRLTPVDGQRIVPSSDGMELPLGGRVLCLIDAPGHARHHIVVWDERTRAFFTGDAFGISYREFDVGGRSFVFPASSPGQFDPLTMIKSIGRMLSHAPQTMYLAHYGKVTGLERLAIDMFRLIHAQVAIAQAARGDGLTRHVEILVGLEELVREECARQQWALNADISLNLLRHDLNLNAQGLGVWLDHQEHEEMKAAMVDNDMEAARVAAA
ncbi:MAG: MBL fold metallo-hydrolase [Azoarcus sp.]|jgi:hydroxyacylglutathione hydrolase|nr:MBL fold metallo-hydrolase [Azoarcus sp.]